MSVTRNTTAGNVLTNKSEHEKTELQKLRSASAEFENYVNDVQWNLNKSFLFTTRQTLSRVLYLNQLYQEIVGKPGVICEFGVQYGATLAMLANLRGIYEPYNFSRKIIGFDTFEGFTSDLTKEEKQHGWKTGDYAVPNDYPGFLAKVLEMHEANAPIPHKRKFELVAGDATKTFDKWLEVNPHVIVAMAIFDMNVYAPTKHVLERVLKVVPKGGVIVFDELNCDAFPGETLAVKEVLGISNIRLRHHPHNPYQAWCVIE